MTNSDRHLLLAACTAVGAVFFLFAMNVLAKLVSDTYAPVEAAFWRNAMSTLILLPFVWRVYGARLPPMSKPKTMVLRSVMGSLTLMLSMTAYFNLPMADANAIILSAPLILTSLAGFLLRENVTRGRIVCTLLGLIGVMVVAHPSGQLSMLGTAVAIAAAISVAFMRVLLRQLGKTEDPLSMTFYFLLIGTIFTATLMPVFGKLPTLETIPVLLAIGCCGALGQYLNAISYKMADASFVGAFVYTQIIWAVPFDYFLWGVHPALHTFIGGGIIIFSNLAIIVLEQRRRARDPSAKA